MPTEPEILGFTNRWYAAAIETAAALTLPSGRVIRAAAPVVLLATKIEAFRRRGNDDMLGSVDFEDIVRLVDGRQALIAEAGTATLDVREYLSSELSDLMADGRFRGALAGALMPDAASQARLPLVFDRFGELAAPPD